MPRWLAINYRGFWDIPRIFFVEDGRHLFLFDCPFSEDLDDYPDVFRVFLMPSLTADDLAGSWADLHRKALRELCTVPTNHVTFDPTKRKFIDAAILDDAAGPAVRLGESPDRG